MTDPTVWPDVDVRAWAPTKRSFHLYLQMLGKVRLALSPIQPNWLFTALYLNPRGLTTGTIPWLGGSVELTLDVFSSEIVIERSNNSTQRIPLLPARTVAAVYADLQRALDALEVACTISTIPQEVPDTTPLHQDSTPPAYDPTAVQRWFSAATATTGILDGWRSHFFGRTGLQVWWGALDVALVLFNGKKVTPPTDRGYIMKYDLDAELMNVGLYYGDENTAPFFYGYIFPEPPNAASMPIGPAGASWSTAIKEWVLPYDTVRNAADPAAALRAFCDTIYAQCIAAAGWDGEALAYAAPKPAMRDR